MMYNEDMRDFTIFSDDISHASISTYTVRGKVEVPTDFTLAESSSKQADIEFQLEMVAGCDMSEFVEWALQEVQTVTVKVLGQTKSLALGPVKDTVSLQTGNNDGLTWCGKRLYKITSSTEIEQALMFDAEND